MPSLRRHPRNDKKLTRGCCEFDFDFGSPHRSHRTLSPAESPEGSYPVHSIGHALSSSRVVSRWKLHALRFNQSGNQRSCNRNSGRSWRRSSLVSGRLVHCQGLLERNMHTRKAVQGRFTLPLWCSWYAPSCWGSCGVLEVSWFDAQNTICQTHGSTDPRQCRPCR